MEKVRQEAQKLAEEHWSYIGKLMELMLGRELELLKFHYTEAFIHGYKHGLEDSVWIEQETREGNNATA